MKILIVGDERKTGSYFGQGLSEAGSSMSSCASLVTVATPSIRKGPDLGLLSSG